MSPLMKEIIASQIFVEKIRAMKFEELEGTLSI